MRGWRKIKQIDGNLEVIDKVMMAVERSGTAALSDTDAVDGSLLVPQVLSQCREFQEQSCIISNYIE